MALDVMCKIIGEYHDAGGVCIDGNRWVLHNVSISIYIAYNECINDIFRVFY